MGVDAPQARYRRARARRSLLLAMYFDRARATTYSLHREAVAILTANAPPNDTDSFLPAFTTDAIYFVKDVLLPGWDSRVPTEAETVHGSEADALLITKAKHWGVPLITNEGFTASGIVDEGMRELAKGARVEVLTPEEFYRARNFDETAAIADFLERFRRHAPERIRSGPSHVRKLLSFMHGYYEHVLLGITDGLDEPVAVSV